MAARIRTSTNLVELENARHALWAVPDLALEDEPDGPAWFSLGATVAWIYAADAKLTSPSVGAVNALKRVADLLDCADEKLGDTALLDGLVGRLTDFSDLQSVLAGIDDQAPAVAAAADRLTPLS